MQNITSSFRIYREFGYSYSNQAGEMAELLNLCVEVSPQVLMHACGQQFSLPS